MSHGESDGPCWPTGWKKARAGAASDGERAPLFGEAVDGPMRPAVLEAELWGCRTCGACQQECPMFFEHFPKTIGMRRYLVMTVKLKAELGDMLEEHTAIVAALKKLAAVAKKEGKRGCERFAEKLILHARTEA